MSNAKNEHSSDLEAARIAARALRSRTAELAPPRAYVRFELSRIDEANASPTTARPEAARIRYGAATWERLLDDAMRIVRSIEAFLLNDQGLVIATRGAIDPDVAEAFGSRVELALEQIDLIAGGRSTRRTLVANLERGWLVAVRFHLADGARVTIGLVAEHLPDERAREALTRLIDAVSSSDREPNQALNRGD